MSYEDRDMHVCIFGLMMFSSIMFCPISHHADSAHRSMATVKNMSHVAVVLEILFQMQEDGILTVHRIKERFLSQPSAGGEYPL